MRQESRGSNQPRRPFWTYFLVVICASRIQPIVNGDIHHPRQDINDTFYPFANILTSAWHSRFSSGPCKLFVTFAQLHNAPRLQTNQPSVVFQANDRVQIFYVSEISRTSCYSSFLKLRQWHLLRFYALGERNKMPSWGWADVCSPQMQCETMPISKPWRMTSQCSFLQ